MTVIAEIKRALGASLSIHEAEANELPNWLEVNSAIPTERLLREYRRVSSGCIEREAVLRAARAQDHENFVRRIRDLVERGVEGADLIVETTGPAVKKCIADWNDTLDLRRAAVLARVLGERYRAEGEPEGLVALRKELKTMGERIAELEGQRRALCRQWAL